jgi:hypothetical protein
LCLMVSMSRLGTREYINDDSDVPSPHEADAPG